MREVGGTEFSVVVTELTTEGELSVDELGTNELSVELVDEI